MLLYEEFTKRLAQGQLKNTAAVDTDVDRSLITDDQAGTILSLTNQALIDLSTRIPIIKKRIKLDFVDGVNIYTLTNNQIDNYLTEIDSFTFDEQEFVRIYRLIDSNGNTISHDTSNSIQTLSFNVVRFTNDKIKEIGEYVTIEYQARHEKLTEENNNILIPPSLELPLQLFVASLFLSHMNNAESSAKGDSYFASYLRHIGQDIQSNTSSLSEIEDTTTRFENNGFV